MEQDFLYPAGELGGRPLRETFVLAGEPIDPELIPAVIGVLDSYLKSRDPSVHPSAHKSPFLHEDDAPLRPEQRIWETKDPARLFDDIDPRFMEGTSEAEILGSIQRLRFGFLADEAGPHVVLLAKGDLDPSKIPTDQDVEFNLDRACEAVRWLVSSILTDVGVRYSWHQGPFAVAHGRVETPKDELATLREICDQLRRESDRSLERDGTLRRALREGVGLEPLDSSSGHASHVLYAGNIHYHVEPLRADLDSHRLTLCSLKLQWPAVGPVDATGDDPTGPLPQVAGRTSEVASVHGVLALAVFQTWIRQLVDQQRAHLKRINDLRTKMAGATTLDLDSLGQVDELAFAVSKVRRAIAWSVANQTRGLRALSRSQTDPELEYGLPPPGWKDRPWEGQDTRFLAHFAGRALDQFEHLRELTTEANDMLGFLSQHVEGRVSIHYAAAMEEHNRWTKVLTVVLAALTALLVLREFGVV